MKSQKLALGALLVVTLGTTVAQAQSVIVRQPMHTYHMQRTNRIWWHGHWVYRNTYWLNHHEGWSYDEPETSVVVTTGRPYHIWWNGGWVDRDREWMRTHHGWRWHHRD